MKSIHTLKEAALLCAVAVILTWVAAIFEGFRAEPNIFWPNLILGIAITACGIGIVVMALKVIAEDDW